VNRMHFQTSHCSRITMVKKKTSGIMRKLSKRSRHEFAFSTFEPCFVKEISQFFFPPN
jgi:hypothetical protein